MCIRDSKCTIVQLEFVHHGSDDGSRCECRGRTAALGVACQLGASRHECGTGWSRCWAATTFCIADSRLCSRAAMGHIAGRGGRFITVLPRSRAEDATFRDWLQTHTPDWTQAARRGGRAGEPEQVYSTTPAGCLSPVWGVGLE